uniref:Uncharacterized protein n=1 Tax=Setaria digitata TaxID=48799 RepID=A0A915PUE5_9BILA
MKVREDCHRSPQQCHRYLQRKGERRSLDRRNTAADPYWDTFYFPGRSQLRQRRRSEEELRLPLFIALILQASP